MCDLSIIIVNWNTREVTRACLQSVFDHLGEGGANGKAEVFVVDNASSDGSQAMIRECYPRVRLIENADNRGFAAANNQALRLSAGRYVLLLNSDTLVLGDVLSRSVDYFDGHPDVGVMGCRVLNEDRTVQLTCSRYPSLFNFLISAFGLSNLRWPRIFGREHMRDWQRDDEREVDVVSGCYLLVRRAAMEQVGLLDETFFFCGEETDWCRRFQNAGWKLKFAPVGEIVHLGNVSGRKRGHRRDIMLSEGLVRFMWKHGAWGKGGRFSAALAWAMLWWFNFSHCLAWGLIALVTRDAAARERSAHFWGVTREFAAAWPKGAGNSTGVAVDPAKEMAKCPSEV